MLRLIGFAYFFYRNFRSARGRVKFEHEIGQRCEEVPFVENGGELGCAGFVLVGDEEFFRNGARSGFDPNLPVDVALGEGEVFAGCAQDGGCADVGAGLDIFGQIAIGIAAEEVVQRHVDAEAFDGGVHGLIKRAGNGDCAVEVFDTIEQGKVVPVEDELAIAPGGTDFDAQSVRASDVKGKRAGGLDLLAGGELDVLPDVGVEGEKFGVLEVIGHAPKPLVGALVDIVIVIRGECGGCKQRDRRQQTHRSAKDRRERNENVHSANFGVRM